MTDTIRQAVALMQQQQFEKAYDVLSADSVATDSDPKIKFYQAVCLRYCGRFNEALDVLSALLNQYPDYAKAYQEIGHCHRDQHENHLALSAYEHAVQLNPMLNASWTNIAQLLKQQHLHAGAQQAQDKAIFNASLPVPVQQAYHWFYEGKIKQAEHQIRRVLQEQPHHIPAMRLLAEIAVKLYVLQDAETILRKAVDLVPKERDVRLELIHVLQKRQNHSDAIHVALEGLKQHPNDPFLTLSLASQYAGLSDFNQAMPLFDNALDMLPDYALGFLQRGHQHKTLGNINEAVRDYREAMRLKPDFGDAYWSLANTKTYEFTDAEITQMHTLLASGHIMKVDQYHIAFALGKAYEDRKSFDNAFQYYQLGNATKRQILRYDPDIVTAEMDVQKRACPPAFFDTVSGCTDPDPIFIVGLPRAGSTLLEQILASHSLIEGTSELPYIIGLSRYIKQKYGEYPDVLHTLSEDELTVLGERYLSQARAHRITNKPYFIDKMPNNFRHLGLIKKILPNAKIIDARREPLSCCFSGYKQLFAEGQEFSYDLDDIAQYYEDYLELMTHWQSCFGENILLVKHEDVVSDLEGSVRGMLRFLGVDFEQSCLQFYQTDRAIKTPSAEQVRQPINPNSNEAWKRFEKHLSSLKERFFISTN